MKEKRKTAFLQNRLLSLFDNILAYIVIIGLGIVIPAIIGFILKIEIQLIFLIILFVGQMIGLALLFNIQKKLSGTKKEKQILVQSDETNDIYFIDDFGLPHPIKDENTQLYFLEILGYKSNEIPKISARGLKPMGANIISIRDWHPPRPLKDERSAEANKWLKILPKNVQVENSKKVISFNLRNDNSEQIIQINSARLVFNGDAPLTIADISSINEPENVGLLACKLLFDGNSKNKALLPQKEYRAYLYTNRNELDSNIDQIIGSRFGYIEIRGLFRETEVYFHLYT